MSRPPDDDWYVLGEETDPIPGNPDGIRQQASRLGEMGRTIREQVGLLKKIGGDPNLAVGKYADKLRSSAVELKGGLGELADRYESVSGYLGKWATDLEYAQSESLRALVKAQQAAPTANAPATTPAPGSPPPTPTPQEEQAQAAAHRRTEAAKSELAQAKAELESAKSYRDERGRYWMQKIEDAEHDSLKDHGLGEWVSNEIHEHASLIKLLADALTWVVTILVIATLLIPGVGIAALVLLGIMGGALALHTALAVNGDGSWTDVVLDLIGMLTIGAGGLAVNDLAGSAKFASGLLKAADSGEGAEEGGEEASAGLAESVTGDEPEAGSGAAKLVTRMQNYGSYLKSAMRAGGDSEAAEHLETITRAKELMPNSRWAERVAVRSAARVHVLGRANLVANGFDQFGHWGGNSDAINFLHNGMAENHWTDGGVTHPDTEGDFAPKLEFMDRFKEMTTVRVD